MHARARECKNFMIRVLQTEFENSIFLKSRSIEKCVHIEFLDIYFPICQVGCLGQVIWICWEKKDKGFEMFVVINDVSE